MMQTYVLQEGREGTVKIGASKNFRQRRGHIQTGNPNKLRFLGFLDVLEADALKDLRKFRTTDSRGGGEEWFFFTPEVVQYLKDHGIQSCKKRWCKRLIAAEPEHPKWPRGRCEDPQCRRMRRDQPERKSSKVAAA